MEVDSTTQSSSSGEDEPVDESNSLNMEQYHQMILFKCLQTASNTKSSQCSKIAQKFKESFKSLILIYFNRTESTKLFKQIDFIENLVATDPETGKKIKSDEIMRTIGDFFYNINFQLNAYKFYRKSIDLSMETNLLALESYENLLNIHIERWHYRMLNDRVRNNAYSLAIFNRLKIILDNQKEKPIRILDIGTGTGLLSALCISQANKLNQSIQIYACETNEFFIEISTKFLKSFNLENNVKVINKHSNKLSIKDDLDNLKVKKILKNKTHVVLMVLFVLILKIFISEYLP